MGTVHTLITYFFCAASEIFRNVSLLNGASEGAKLVKTLNRLKGAVFNTSDTRVVDVSSQVVPVSPSTSQLSKGAQDDETSTAHKTLSKHTSRASAIMDAHEKLHYVLRELVTVCNIMEGSAIVWITLLFVFVPVNPYDIGGDALEPGTVVLHGVMGLGVEVLCDFTCYFVSALLKRLTMNMENFTASTFALDSRTAIQALGVFAIVLAMCMEAVGHVYEELCPMAKPNSTDIFLTACPEHMAVHDH